MKIILIIFALIILPLSVQATTFTVCASGCDEVTIQAVFDNNDLAPDDIIDVSGGTYNEEITWGSNDIGSSASALVTLQGAVGETVIINGGSARALKFAGDGIDYLKLKNLTLTNDGTTQVLFRQTGTSTGPVIEDVIVLGVGQDAVYLDDIEDSIIDGLTISGQSRYGLYIVDASGTLTLGGISVTGGGSGNTIGAINVIGAVNITVDGDLTVTNTTGPGMRIQTVTGTFITNSDTTLTSTNAGDRGIWVDGNGSASTLQWNGEVLITGSGDDGLYLDDSPLVAGSYIKRIVSSGNTDNGIELDDSKNITFKSYKSYDNTNTGVRVDATDVNPMSGIVFTSDLTLGYGQSEIYNNGNDGFSTEAQGATTTATIEYTKIYNMGGGGVPILEGDGITSHSDAIVYAYSNTIYDNDNTCFAFIDTSVLFAYNNTCYSNGVAGGPRAGYFSTSTGNATLKNNIFSESLPLEIRVTAAQIAGSIYDYNLWYHPVDANFADTDNDGSADFATNVLLEASESEFTNGIESDPLFTNASTGDFTLTSSSPAIGAGTWYDNYTHLICYGLTCSNKTPPDIGSHFN